MTHILQHAETNYMDVKSASRTLDLFEVFAREQQPLTLSEVAAALDAPLSSCFNLVRALKGRGFLYGVGTRRQIPSDAEDVRHRRRHSDRRASGRRFTPRLEAWEQTFKTAIPGREQHGQISISRCSKASKTFVIPGGRAT